MREALEGHQPAAEPTQRPAPKPKHGRRSGPRSAPHPAEPHRAEPRSAPYKAEPRSVTH